MSNAGDEFVDDHETAVCICGGEYDVGGVDARDVSGGNGMAGVCVEWLRRSFVGGLLVSSSPISSVALSQRVG